MTEEIIIDGVNVAGCEFCKPNPLYKIEYACHCRGCVQDDGLHVHSSCEHNPNCYYKQLKCKEQENKELKEDVLKWQKAFSRQYQINENKGYSKAEENYRSALEEIKNNFMCFRSCMIPFHVGDKDNLPHKMADAIQNYCESIINKINEVLQ